MGHASAGRLPADFMLAMCAHCNLQRGECDHALVWEALRLLRDQHAALTAVAEAAKDVAKEPCARTLVVLEAALAALEGNHTSVSQQGG